eukprot:m.38466 g.38466  ORF g.38466 m.38466 type:complete len:771 (-) comp14627_c0_seq6:260-2572(-)
MQRPSSVVGGRTSKLERASTAPVAITMLPSTTARPTELLLSDTIVEDTRIVRNNGRGSASPSRMPTLGRSIGGRPGTATSSFSRSSWSPDRRPQSAVFMRNGGSPTERPASVLSVWSDASIDSAVPPPRSQRMRRPSSVSSTRSIASLGSLSRPSTALPRDSAQLKKMLTQADPQIEARAESAYERRLPPDQRTLAIRRRETEKAFQRWVAKDKVKKAEIAKSKQAETRQFKAYMKELFETQKIQGDRAYEEWLLRKADEDMKRHGYMDDRTLARLLRQPYAMKELEGALTRVIADDAFFVTVKQCLEELAVTQPGGKIRERALLNMLVHAEVDVLIDQKLLDRQRNPDAPATGKKGKGGDGDGDDNSVLVAKVGKTLLDGMKAVHRDFFDQLFAFRALFTLNGRNDGHVSREDCKKGLDAAGLPLGTPQLLEVYKVLDAENVGIVLYTTFASVYVGAYVATLDPSHSRAKASPAIERAKGILERISADDFEDMITDVLSQAEKDRRDKLMNVETGKLGLWEFRNVLRRLCLEGLSPSKRNSLCKGLEKAFRCVSEDGGKTILWSDLDLFLRQLNVSLHEEKRRRKTVASLTHKDHILLNIGKTFLRNMQRKSGQRLFGNVINNVSDLFRAIDQDHSGQLSKLEMREALRRMDCGLTLSQEDALIALMDTDGNGEIDLTEFKAFLELAASHVDEQNARKTMLKDKKIAIMHSIIDATDADADVLMPTLLQIKSLCLGTLDGKAAGARTVAAQSAAVTVAVCDAVPETTRV